MAMRAWDEILGWNQEQLNDLRFVGYAYLKQGKYDIAIEIFETLLLLGSTEYDLQTLGALYLQVGDNFPALDVLLRALKIAPDHEGTRLNRVKALFSLGYKQQAAVCAQELLSHATSSIADQASALLMAL